MAVLDQFKHGLRFCWSDISEEDIGPLGHACQLGCGDLCLRLHIQYFEVEGAGSSWPLGYTTSLLIPSPQAVAVAHH